MISDWRAAWNMGDLPFIWVQLPNFGEVYSAPQAWDAWPQLRRNQSRALSLPNTGEAVTIDLGALDIHPTHKQPVGERLALAALKVAYSEDTVFSGPRYKSHEILPDGKIVIRFDYMSSGLIAKDSVSGVVTGFSMADNSGNLAWAHAVVGGDSVVVWNSSIANPAIVRYAWEFNPACNLYNAENLPAAPFSFFVTPPGFSLKSFNASSLTLERGQTSVLSWETYGVSSVTLNDQAVDSISGKRVQPLETTSYTLKITDHSDPVNTLEKSITIVVVEPKPKISIRTDVGGIAAPGTEITLIAEATAPTGKTVKQVDFFINDLLIGTDKVSPYTMSWTPADTGKFAFTARVTDSGDLTTTSAVMELIVTRLKMMVYEAENAQCTGTSSVVSSTKASGQKYRDMQSGWVLTFSQVEVPETDTYPMIIRFLLNYESPKAQALIVNGNASGEILFTSPDKNMWMSYVANVPLNKGMNTIAFDGVWEWMSMDYIAIAVKDTTAVGVKETNSRDEVFMNMYPNPVSTVSTFSYFLPQEGNVTIEIFSFEGRKLTELVCDKKAAGVHEAIIDATQFAPGIYFTKLTINKAIYSQRFVIIGN